MNKSLKKKWTKKLRSDEYVQGKGQCKYCVSVKAHVPTCRSSAPREHASMPWTCTREYKHTGQHIACGGYLAHEMYSWSARDKQNVGTNNG